MRRTVLSVCLGILSFVGAVTASAAPAENELAAAMLIPVNKFIDHAYAGDFAGASTAYSNAPGSEIIDGFPPYIWHGTKAFATWYAALQDAIKVNGLVGGKIALDKPLHAESHGNIGYLIVPAVFSVKVKGNDFVESAVMTYILDKSKDGWLIRSWIWSGPLKVERPAQ